MLYSICLNHAAKVKCMPVISQKISSLEHQEHNKSQSEQIHSILETPIQVSSDNWGHHPNEVFLLVSLKHGQKASQQTNTPILLSFWEESIVAVGN